MAEKQEEKKDDEEEEEEDAPMVDDMDKDRDYDPDQDPEAQFTVEYQDIKEEDIFEVEKHVHAGNIEEAGDYLVAMRRYMEAFTKNCKKRQV